MEQLLTIDQAAAMLGTGERFIRRLIAERRIRFHKVGRHVRIAVADLEAFIAATAVEPRRAAVAAWTPRGRSRPGPPRDNQRAAS